MAGFNAQFNETNTMSAQFTEPHSMNAQFGQTQFVHTDNYNDLYNKPSIENIVLQGNKTFKQLGMEAATVQEVEAVLYLG